jgi:hypothetical protein
MQNEINEEFSGVFMFTNPTKKDRAYLWNNKEYTFPAESTVPLIIPSESLDNVQEIRKRFAYRMAEERLYEGEKTPSGFDYKKAKDMGNGIPPTFDAKILEPFIHECLKPLPVKRGGVKQGNQIDDERKYKATKAMGKNDNPVALFKEENENIPVLGAMTGE